MITVPFPKTINGCVNFTHANFNNPKVIASNDKDEPTIKHMVLNGSISDVFSRDINSKKGVLALGNTNSKSGVVSELG